MSERAESHTDESTERWVTEYRRCGFVKLPGVFSKAEMNDVREDFDRLFDDPNVLREDSLRCMTRQSLNSGEVLDRLDPVIDLSPCIKELTQDRRIVSAASAVIGQPALLFKDKAIMKQPGAFGYDVHQDYTNWQELPIPAHLLVSALVAIDPGMAANGGLELYSGLHHRHLRPSEKPSDIFDPKAGLLDESVLEGVKPELIEVESGDLILFSSLAPHRSGPNRSQQKRRTLFLSYSPVSHGDIYEHYYRNFYGYLAKDRGMM